MVCAPYLQSIVISLVDSISHSDKALLLAKSRVAKASMPGHAVADLLDTSSTPSIGRQLPETDPHSWDSERAKVKSFKG